MHLTCAYTHMHTQACVHNHTQIHTLACLHKHYTYAHMQHTLCVSACAELSWPVQAQGPSNLLGIEKILLLLLPGRATKRELGLCWAPEDKKPLARVQDIHSLCCHDGYRGRFAKGLQSQVGPVARTREHSAVSQGGTGPVQYAAGR